MIVQGVIIHSGESTFSETESKNIKSFSVAYGFNGYDLKTYQDPIGQNKVGFSNTGMMD